MTRIGITGSPGTGKKSVGKVLARLLGLHFLSLSDYAVEKKFGKWLGREYLVDPSKIRRARIKTLNTVVTGHLLPYVLHRKDLDFVAVLRCSPEVLKVRYRKRHYSESKSLENLLAEALDIISFEALKTFGPKKVAEFDTSHKSASLSAKAIVQTMRGKKRRSYGKVKWKLDLKEIGII
jgi:adenylate kinase